MIEFLCNHFLDILLVLVGLSAFGVYFWQKHDETRTAATLVLGEIDSIEKVVSSLKNDHKLNNQSIYRSKQILREDLWDKYKYLLVKHLSQSEIKSIELFFDNAEQMEHARVDIVNSMNDDWTHASLAIHFLAGSILQSDTNLHDLSHVEQRIDELTQAYGKLDIVLTPNIAIDLLLKYLENFSMLSGTTGYEKLRKLSYGK